MGGAGLRAQDTERIYTGQAMRNVHRLLTFTRDALLVGTGL